MTGGRLNNFHQSITVWSKEQAKVQIIVLSSTQTFWFFTTQPQCHSAIENCCLMKRVTLLATPNKHRVKFNISQAPRQSSREFYCNQCNSSRHVGLLEVKEKPKIGFNDFFIHQDFFSGLFDVVAFCSFTTMSAKPMWLQPKKVSMSYKRRLLEYFCPLRNCSIAWIYLNTSNCHECFHAHFFFHRLLYSYLGLPLPFVGAIGSTTILQNTTSDDII